MEDGEEQRNLELMNASDKSPNLSTVDGNEASDPEDLAADAGI